MDEIWKVIPGYEGLYEASNLGNIRSLPKEWVVGIGKKRSHNGFMLKLCKNSRGYNLVTLCNNSVRKNINVHQLVAMAFLDHKPCGLKLVVDHINDDRLDNRVENLQIVTQRFNSHKTQGKYASQYKGVHWSKDRNKWVAGIVINGKYKSLGRFINEIDAHNAYQIELKQLDK